MRSCLSMESPFCKIFSGIPNLIIIYATSQPEPAKLAHFGLRETIKNGFAQGYPPKGSTKKSEKEEKIRIQIRDLHCLLGLVLGPIPKQGGEGPVQDS